ncbi:SprT-like family-domain-containing protein [Amylocarpus encephaloides]|uniref:SprT-like family-domain-containing protein n=1 Tax=Amylocarpus encephaloides TaxID=45428 RepID=A0A9P7YB65_9HELO|nr:SprT-like family-domain-containing protein [Amylocarpus encephaloides]
MIKKPVSRSARKLVRGRRPERKDSVDDDLEPGMGRSNVGDSQDSKDLVQKGGKKPDFKSAKTDAMENRKPSRENTSASERKGLPEQMEVKTLPATNRRKVDGPSALPLIISKSKTKEKEKAISKKKPQPPSSDLDDPFTLRFSPPATKPRNTTKETRFATPPSSPKLKPLGFVSPFKQIPATPHRQSEDAFWSQGVINDWNDEYSPQKKLLPTPKLKSSLDDEGSEGNLLFSPTKMSPVKQDRVTKYAKKAFEQKKHALADSFLAELDDKITNGRISELAGSTGGVKIIWNKKLNSTAGRANWKRETIKSSKLRADGNPAPPTIRNHASIELAEKVIDDEDRLLNVIAHEFCHLANFMVSNIRNNPHGKEFQAWGSNCSREFSSRGIKVTTKHSYAIDYKYIWECQNSTCAIEYKRHSKSIDPIRHQCGKCKGKLVQVKPVPKKVVEGKPKINAYQAFVKEHMKVVREENPGSPQKEIMGLVSRRYKEYKASQLGRKDGEEKGGSKERKPDVEDDSMGNVARKLDFLDLTSP